MHPVVDYTNFQPAVADMFTFTQCSVYWSWLSSLCLWCSPSGEAQAHCRWDAPRGPARFNGSLPHSSLGLQCHIGSIGSLPVEVIAYWMLPGFSVVFPIRYKTIARKEGISNNTMEKMCQKKRGFSVRNQLLIIVTNMQYIKHRNNLYII